MYHIQDTVKRSLLCHNRGWPRLGSDRSCLPQTDSAAGTLSVADSPVDQAGEGDIRLEAGDG